MLNLCWIILGMPLAAAALIFLGLIPAEKSSVEKSVFRNSAATLTVLSIAAGFVLALILLNQTRAATGYHGEALESSLTWLAFAGLKIEIGILFNPLSLLMALIVTGVAALVAIFSARYMQGEEGYSRYFAAFSFFVFSMLGIVFSNNLIQLFIFWELVGVSSYLLIGFWFEKPSASAAAKKSFLVTRIGDAGMMLGILLLLGLLASSNKGSFNFLELETRLHQIALPAGLFALACIGIFMGAVGKSAQVPLHVWLPDAMEGPTPASALIHAATMVAAGVFMIARLFFIFEMSPLALQVIAWTGVITAFVAASVAVVQNDIKKILAYSTLSQLGYMIMALGAGSPQAGMFHLTTHAFFKALLFLGAGSLIHAAHSQDIWALGLFASAPSVRPAFGFKNAYFKKMPITAITFLIGTAALTGLPFTSGFFSKEEILGAAFAYSKCIFALALAVVFLTAFYMGRAVTVILCGTPAAEKKHAHDLHEDNFFITLPLVVLAVFSLAAGYLPIQSFLESAGGHAPHGPAWLAVVSVALAAAGLLLSFLLYRGKTSEKHLPILGGMVRLLQEKYFFDRFYDWLVASVQENFARLVMLFEKYIVVNLAGFAALCAQVIGGGARRLQNGKLQTYGLIFALGWMAVVVFMICHRGLS